MKKFLLAVLCCAGLISGPAVAADMPMPAPVIMRQPVPFVAAVFNWTGVYIGLYAGGGLQDRNATTTDPFSGATFYNPPGNPYAYRLNGGTLAGGTLGWNWQPVNSHFVVGLEAEGGYINFSRTMTDPNTATLGATDGIDHSLIGDAYGVIAARLGLAWDRVLFYGKGGGLIVGKHFDWTDTCIILPCNATTLTINRNRAYLSWAAGGGFEVAISQVFTIKAEYLYMATRESFNATGIASTTAVYSTTHTDPGVHTAKIGLNYLFR